MGDHYLEIDFRFLSFRMPKYKKKNAKKATNSSQPYDVQVAPQIVAARERPQETTASAQESQAESFSCDKCSKSTDHLLQCAYFALWYCNVCCNIHN